MLFIERTLFKELLALVFVFSAASANASTQYLFGFDYHGNFVSGYGSIHGTDNGDGTYTAIDGEAYQTIGSSTQQLTLIPNPDGSNQSISPAGAFTFDDQILLGSSPQLSGDGLLFMSPNQEINLANVATAGLALRLAARTAGLLPQGQPRQRTVAGQQ